MEVINETVRQYDSTSVRIHLTRLRAAARPGMALIAPTVGSSREEAPSYLLHVNTPARQTVRQSARPSVLPIDTATRAGLFRHEVGPGAFDCSLPST